MSSEHDEIADEVKSDAEKSDSPSPSKKSGEGGIAKPKRKGRRGKRRKQRKESGGGDMSEDRDSNEEPEPSNYSGQLLRPNAPHAPKNSTQFIIDDHNECRLYMSFETPNPYITDNMEQPRVGSMEPIGEDAAYVDVDYRYESPQDFDNTAYFDREFEISYKSNRFEELLRLPREKLVSGLRQLELRLKELSDDLVKENPSPILEKLQHDLLELQEKHCELQEANTRLTALVARKEKQDVAEEFPDDEQKRQQPTGATDVERERSSVETDSELGEQRRRPSGENDVEQELSSTETDSQRPSVETDSELGESGESPTGEGPSERQKRPSRSGSSAEKDSELREKETSRSVFVQIGGSKDIVVDSELLVGCVPSKINRTDTSD